MDIFALVVVYLLIGWTGHVMFIRWDTRKSKLPQHVDDEDVIVVAMTSLLWPLILAFLILYGFGKLTEKAINYGRE